VRVRRGDVDIRANVVIRDPDESAPDAAAVPVADEIGGNPKERVAPMRVALVPDAGAKKPIVGFLQKIVETYPTVVQGKPTDIWTLPAFFPVMFELTILFSAFTTLFGTFGDSFFQAYSSWLPMEPAFHELRCNLYKLYPTLVHVRLFGSAYIPPIEQTLSRVGL